MGSSANYITNIQSETNARKWALQKTWTENTCLITKLKMFTANTECHPCVPLIATQVQKYIPYLSLYEPLFQLYLIIIGKSLFQTT